MRSGLFTLLGMAAFGVILFLGARGEARIECDVCIVFEGRTECHRAQGGDAATARDGAMSHICAELANGVTQTMRCHATPPSSFECRSLP